MYMQVKYSLCMTIVYLTIKHVQLKKGEWMIELNKTWNGQHCRSASFPEGIAEDLHAEK